MRASRLLVLLASVLLASGTRAVAEDSSRQVSFGVMVAQKGLWQEARFRFERAIALEPKNAAALNDLAVTLEQMGEFEKARQCYEKALGLKPGNIYIQQNFDLFREADDKRNRKSRKTKSPAEGAGRSPAAKPPGPQPADKPPSEGPDRPSGDKPASEKPDRLSGDKPPSEGPDRAPEGR
jgi:tetratricopeptide (TPR) repeat protein